MLFKYRKSSFSNAYVVVLKINLLTSLKLIVLGNYLGKNTRHNVFLLIVLKAIEHCSILYLTMYVLHHKVRFRHKFERWDHQEEFPPST